MSDDRFVVRVGWPLMSFLTTSRTAVEAQAAIHAYYEGTAGGPAVVRDNRDESDRYFEHDGTTLRAVQS